MLKGLGYLKGRESPIAGEDDEYPDWLWGLLDKDKGRTGKDSEKGAEGDVFCEFLVFGGFYFGGRIRYSCLELSLHPGCPFSLSNLQLTSHVFLAKSKKQRRIAVNAARKAALDPSRRIRVVPYEHQTIDLPVAGNAVGGERGWEVAQRAREKLTQAMRVQRRKAIKESNFLKSMK